MRNMSYSDYWRVNKSYVSHEELINALRALRKVVGYLGIKRETVWTGFPTQLPGTERIELPLLLAQGTYPIPPDKMDVLVGLAIHETMHIRDDTQHAWGYLSQMFPRMEDKTDLCNIADAGEDIHVDGAAIKMGLLGKYVRKSRAWWRENTKEDFTLGLPNEERLLGVWLDIVLDGIFPVLPPEKMDDMRVAMAKIPSLNDESVPQAEVEHLVEILCNGNLERIFYIQRILVSMPQDYMKPLHMLILNTPEIIESDPENRALLYREFWTKLEAIFAEWNAAIEAAKLSPQGIIEASTTEFEEIGGGTELPPEIADAIQAGLGNEVEDVTARIENVLRTLGGSSERHLLYPAVFQDGIELCRTAPHRKLVGRLKEIFRLQREESARTHHGLRSGKLDPRRLYRSYTTGMIFKQKEYFPENTQWSITLLLDASGSVLWRWDFIESVYAALVEALIEGNVKLEVYAYKETEMLCEITRLFYDHGLYTIKPSGTTPTGEAVIATGLIMPPAARKLTIHVTDGLWNTGVDTWYALEFCTREKIDLVTLGCGNAKRAFELQYGKSFEIMESIEELPRALEALLRKKLLVGVG